MFTVCSAVAISARDKSSKWKEKGKNPTGLKRRGRRGSGGREHRKEFLQLITFE